MKIAAVVVTYNRKVLLAECLQALQKQSYQLNSIIIIDNASTDGTEGMLKEEFLRDEIFSYIRLRQNTGGAGGFKKGIEVALQRGFDWIWIMDDDAEPKLNSLEKIIKSKIFSEKASAFTSLKFDGQGKRLDRHTGFFDYSYFASAKNSLANRDLNREYLEIELVSFVGVLINKKAVQKVGLPAEKLFIQYDDTEYSFRLRRYGKIYLIPGSVIIHKEISNNIPRKFLGREFLRSRLNGIWKEYYGFRNILFLFQNGHLPKWRFISFFWYLIKTTLAIILLDNRPFFRLRYYYQGLFDGLRGVYGKTVDPKEFLTKYRDFLENNNS